MSTAKLSFWVPAPRGTRLATPSTRLRDEGHLSRDE